MPIVAKLLQLPAAQFAPASSANSFAVAPSDTDQLAQTTRYLYVGVAGDITLLLTGDSTAVLLKAVPVGLYALAVKQVKATGTTATNLVGLY